MQIRLPAKAASKILCYTDLSSAPLRTSFIPNQNLLDTIHFHRYLTLLHALLPRILLSFSKVFHRSLPVLTSEGLNIRGRMSPAPPLSREVKAGGSQTPEDASTLSFALQSPLL